MQEIINIIKEWPVIVQGALGSGLFWLTLLIGQKIIEFLSYRYSKHSTKTRKTWLINRTAVIGLRLSYSVEEQGVYTSILLYRASRFLFHALMWLALGLTVQVIFVPLSIIGFLGCLYYLIKGISVVGASSKSEKELEKELKSIHEELRVINND